MIGVMSIIPNVGTICRNGRRIGYDRVKAQRTQRL